MKRILIISHSFPPLNLISSRRAEAYANNFPQFGFSATVITELRESNNGNKEKPWIWHAPGTAVKKEVNGKYSVYYIPRIKTNSQKLIDFLLRVPVIKELSRSVLVFFGHPHGDYYYCYQQFRSFLWDHLKENKYDCILPSYKPDYPLMLAYEIQKKFGIPFVADYRDLWDNRLVNIQQEFGLKDRFLQWFAKWNHRKWVGKALFFVIVNKPLRELLTRYTGKKEGYVIPNGFEKNAFLHDKTDISKDHFFVTYTGNIYPENDFSFFYKAFRSFTDSLGENDQDKIRVRIFTHPSYNLDEQKENIAGRYLEVHGWVSKEEVVKKLRESSILLTLGFTNQPGTVPGKVFEYLGSGRNILVTPSDNNVVNDMIAETNTGLCSSDIEKVAAFLKDKFGEWKNAGKPSYYGNTEEINKYSREKQVERVAALINDHLAGKQ